MSQRIVPTEDKTKLALKEWPYLADEYIELCFNYKMKQTFISYIWDRYYWHYSKDAIEHRLKS